MCGDTPLNSAFPSLFVMATSEESWVSDCWSGRGDGEGWNPSFPRPFNDWEVEDAARLLAKLGRYMVVLEVEDH